MLSKKILKQKKEDCTLNINLIQFRININNLFNNSRRLLQKCVTPINNKLSKGQLQSARSIRIKSSELEVFLHNNGHPDIIFVTEPSN